MTIAKGLSFVFGTAVDLFYRRRLLPGAQVPARGPVLLVANHPNALVDPIVVQNAVVESAGRRVRMLAKAPLFSMPGISSLMKGMEAIPVYRSQDGADTRQNAETFRAVEEALVGGSAVLIFPEGLSHHQPSVQPLKTGAARMALRAYARGARDVVIVPVGLSYADKLRFRSTAAVEIGGSIRVADYAPVGTGETDEELERAAVKSLTAAIVSGLLQVTVNLESWEDLPLLEAIDAIWRQDDPERTHRIKSLADGTTLLRQEDPAYFDDLRSRLSDWLWRLRGLGLGPRDVAEAAMQARRNPWKLAQFTARNLFAFTVGLPFALWGALFWSAPFWTVHLVWMFWRAKPDVGATVKLLAALVLYPLWYLAALLALAHYIPPNQVLAAALLSPPAGMMTRHYFRRRFFAVQQLITFLSLGLRGQLLQALVRERDAFCREFDAVAARVEARRTARS